MALDVEGESWRRGSKFRRSDAREKLPFAFGAEHYVAFLGQRQQYVVGALAVFPQILAVVYVERYCKALSFCLAHSLFGNVGSAL